MRRLKLRPLISFKILPLLLVALYLCGCESQKPRLVQLYSGPPRSGMAIVSIREPAAGIPEGHDGPLWIREVDGKTCYAGSIELPPGDHTFGLMFTKLIVTKDGIKRMRDRSYIRGHVVTQPNHVYLLHSRVIDENDGVVHGAVYPMDVTGHVTVSTNGIIQFPKEFETYWLTHTKVADDYKERQVFQ